MTVSKILNFLSEFRFVSAFKFLNVCVCLSIRLSFIPVCLSVCLSFLVFVPAKHYLIFTTLLITLYLFLYSSKSITSLYICLSHILSSYSHDCQSGYLPIPVTSKIFFLFSSEPNKGPLSVLVSLFYGLKFFRMFLKFSFFVRRRKRSNSTIAIPEKNHSTLSVSCPLRDQFASSPNLRSFLVKPIKNPLCLKKTKNKNNNKHKQKTQIQNCCK